MRRKDRELNDMELISQIIGNCQVCRLGLAHENSPYIVPVAFGYDGRFLYFHTAREGKKIDYLRANSSVCFEFEYRVELIPHDKAPCKWSFAFQTVIGYGQARELLSTGARIEALKQIMAQYSDKDWAISEEMLSGLRVWQIEIDSMSAKQSPARSQSGLMVSSAAT